ncbi:dioxygenase [Delftia sp. PS-11]|uniref:dioxygenase family protein n=1 Tax=Delftia sp. PS-11 TaxID=2767222 RepID=UPI0024560073|nr:class III extradiol ring-cleavage dioxygenase [Delftia sp. PS-11]KAJ8743991.1 dioxygenase [Delftia sp. PS-11]
MQDSRAFSPAAGSRLPVLYVSHGSPMFALEPGETGPALARWGSALRQSHGTLRAVVVLSPHWMSHGVEVMTGTAPSTWHDFGGFPPALYALQYPAPGAPQLALEVMQRLQAAGIAATANAQRPFDHGAWVPLMHLLPGADVPVIQLSLPASAGPAETHALGAALAGLRDEGVLLVGSGSMTHNLREFRGGTGEATMGVAQAVHAMLGELGEDTALADGAVGSSSASLPYVQDFSRWIEARMRRHDLPALLAYRSRAPGAQRAHPTDEHFMPLYFALGAAGAAARPRYLSREVMYDMLAMDAVAFEDAQPA